MTRSLPLWAMAPRAMRRFMLFTSLPRTFFPTVCAMLGFGPHIGVSGKIVALTFSISEDFARVWWYFARRHLDMRACDAIIVDSRGDFRPGLFPGARVIRHFNFYHGRKIDFFIRRVIRSSRVFLSDDDRYLMADIRPYAAWLDVPMTAAVSLHPRSWYSFRIGGVDHAPMGSYALLFDPALFIMNGWRFRSPRSICSPYKHFSDSRIKRQSTYDTGDHANERILFAGYSISVADGPDVVPGFDCMSAAHIVLRRYGPERSLAALAAAPHYREGSVNGATMRGMYCNASFEVLFGAIFHEPPLFSCGFPPSRIRDIVLGNQLLSPPEHALAAAYFDRIDAVFERLVSRI